MSAAVKLNPQPNIKLVVQQGPHAGQRFSFSKNKITIGRSPENDIVLVNDPLISRQHAYIEIANNDVEIINLSQKNPVLINNESITKWKLTNDTVFVVGGTEFLIQIENQQSVVVMKPAAPSPVALVKSAPTVAKTRPPLQRTASSPAKNLLQNTMRPQPTFSPSTVNTTNLTSNPKFKFYVVIGLVLALGLYFGLSDSENNTSKKNKKAILKYSDEIQMKVNSSETAEAFRKQEIASKIKQSSGYIRAEENFTKGIRAYQLNNYSSAKDYFQLALISQPDHVLARRYLYLSKVRFDEVLKAKIELGQNYYQRNNFKLCVSMYQQVIDMLAPPAGSTKEVLQASAKDTNLQLAQTMLKKCEFAAEGIH